MKSRRQFRNQKLNRRRIKRQSEICSADVNIATYISHQLDFIIPLLENSNTGVPLSYIESDGITEGKHRYICDLRECNKFFKNWEKAYKSPGAFTNEDREFIKNRDNMCLKFAGLLPSLFI